MQKASSWTAAAPDWANHSDQRGRAKRVALEQKPLVSGRGTIGWYSWAPGRVGLRGRAADVGQITTGGGVEVERWIQHYSGWSTAAGRWWALGHSPGPANGTWAVAGRGDGWEDHARHGRDVAGLVQAVAESAGMRALERTRWTPAAGVFCSDEPWLQALAPHDERLKDNPRCRVRRAETERDAAGG